MKRVPVQCRTMISLGLVMVSGFVATSLAQVAPIRPSDRVGPSDSSSSQATVEDETGEAPSGEVVSLMVAHARFEIKDYAAARKGFQDFLRKHGKAEHRDDDVIRAYHSMATSCMELKDYDQAIEALNRLDQWIDDVSIPYRRGRCYERMEQYAAAADEWRRAVALVPDNPFFRLELATLLVTTPDVRVQNGEEALSLLKGFESQMEEMPRIAMTLAAAASITGDFDFAVKMQEKFLGLSNEPEMMEYSQFLLACYRDRNTPFPLFNRALSPIKEEECQRILEKGTVLVRVRGRISHHLVERGHCELEQVERDHAGAVLDARGIILVSGATIEITPFVENGIRPEQESKWINGPFIEVYSMPQQNSKPRWIGHAEVVGHDQATQVGVIRIKDSSPIDRIDGLQAIEFQTGNLVEMADKADACYSLNIWGGVSTRLTSSDALEVAMLTTGSPISSLSYELLPLAIDQDTYKVHQGYAAKDARVYASNFAQWSDGRLRIGQPIVNRGGQCVAIASPIIGPDAEARLVGIPARVLSRVSSKLISYGRVDRARLPVELTPVASRIQVGEVGRTVGGMQVTAVSKNDRRYAEIEGHVILSVDGHPTPSTTEWLIATERADARGQDAIQCQITPSIGDVVRTVELPLVR